MSTLAEVPDHPGRHRWTSQGHLSCPDTEGWWLVPMSPAHSTFGGTRGILRRFGLSRWDRSVGPSLGVPHKRRQSMEGVDGHRARTWGRGRPREGFVPCVDGAQWRPGLGGGSVVGVAAAPAPAEPRLCPAPAPQAERELSLTHNHGGLGVTAGGRTGSHTFRLCYLHS